MTDKEDRKRTAFTKDRAFEARPAQDGEHPQHIEAGPNYAADMALFRKVRREHAPLLKALAKR